MKCLTKNLIILFALLFLSLVFLGRTVYRSYTEGSKVHKQEEVNLNQDKGNKNFEILEVQVKRRSKWKKVLAMKLQK